MNFLNLPATPTERGSVLDLYFSLNLLMTFLLIMVSQDNLDFLTNTVLDFIIIIALIIYYPLVCNDNK